MNRLMDTPVPFIVLSDTEDETTATHKKKCKSSRGAAIKEPPIENVPESKPARITSPPTATDFNFVAQGARPPISWANSEVTSTTQYYEGLVCIEDLLDTFNEMPLHNNLSITNINGATLKDFVQNGASTSRHDNGSVILLDAGGIVPRVADVGRFQPPLSLPDCGLWNVDGYEGIVIIEDLLEISSFNEVRRPLCNHLSEIDKERRLTLRNDVANIALDGRFQPLCNEGVVIIEDLLENSTNEVPLRNEDFVQNAASTWRNNNGVILLDAGGIIPRVADVPMAVNDRRIADVARVPRPIAVRHLRPIVIDGSNIARNHGNRRDKVFSCRGIQISVEFFLARDHKVTVFVPKFRKHRTSGKCPTTDPHILDELENEERLVYTPTRYLDGLLIQCHDNRFIVRCASETGGVVLSNDNFIDIIGESESFRTTISERLLMYCFAGDTLMIPDDPLGRDGPLLGQFLTFPE